jgi:oxaloacetate decarboxylase gamma subunit
LRPSPGAIPDDNETYKRRGKRVPVSDLMMTGLQLMLLGMGIVFGFLILLVFGLKAMSWVAGHFDSGEAAAAVVPALAQPADGDNRLIAVISAAVARYRADRGN